MSSDFSSVLSWLNSDGDSGVGRKKQLEVADWICDPKPVRQTEQLEFTDLTNLNHRIKTELSDPLWPLFREGAEEEKSAGLIVLGFMRRGIPLQHTKVTLRRNGQEFPLTRLKMSQTEELALGLLDNIWTQCSKDELKLERARGLNHPDIFAIPRPLEFSREDEKELDRKAPTRSDGAQRYISRFWREFLGIGSRNVNADWALLDSRFDLRESWRANELWRQPMPDEPKWSFERALLAKLSARLAFSYILSAWVPNEVSKGEGPVEIELDFQERVLDPQEQEGRIALLRKRSKKAFQRTLTANLGDPETAEPEDLVKDGLRLNSVPETYLGLLDPALDDPDDGRRLSRDTELSDASEATEYVREVEKRSWFARSIRSIGRTFVRDLASIGRYVASRIWFLVFPAAFITIILVWLYLNAANALVIQEDSLPVILGSLVPANSLFMGVIMLFSATLLSGIVVASKLSIDRRSTVILPTWSTGTSSPIYEVTTPSEFSVWQGILTRPSNRGRGWKTRPAAELGRKASLWWQDPSDRGHVPAQVPGRPHLLIMELRARMSRDLIVYGCGLCFLAAILLLVPALTHLFDPGRWSLLENVAADTVTTVLLLLPTAGGALLIRPGEDPIASRLLRSDRLVIGIGAAMSSALAVVMIILLGWPDPAKPVDENPESSRVAQERVAERTRGEEPGQTVESESFRSTDQSREFWIIWLILGSVSLIAGFALLTSVRGARSLSRSQPASRQGGRDSSRRKPLDVPAPVPSLRYWWGRRFARRSLLRLAPKRGIRRTKPCYSLVLPAEGSRIYTPPSPTVLCLVPEEEGTLPCLIPEEEGTPLLEKYASQLEKYIDASTRNEIPIYTTNDIAWVVSSSLRIVRPVKSFSTSKSDLERYLLNLLRIQTANARPSKSKPYGNGGGICLMSIPKAQFKKLREGSAKDTFDLGSSPVLVDSGPPNKLPDSPALISLKAAINRVALDFDGLLLLETDCDQTTFEVLDELGSEVSCEAARRARVSGSSSGAHPWPSSLESPLAGESELWRGASGGGTFSSLRWPLLRATRRNKRLERFLQRHIFDHRSRKIPAAHVRLMKDETPRTPEKLSAPEREFFDWFEKIPRVYSRRFARGGFPTRVAPPKPPPPIKEPPPLPPKEPKLVYVAGNVGSGKSTLAIKVRQKLAREFRKQWEVVRPDSNHNLFFQLLNLNEPQNIDALDSSYSRYDIEPKVEDHIAFLMEATFLLEIGSRLRDELSTGYPPDGVLVEYWPEFSVEVMAEAQLGSAKNGQYYLSKLRALRDQVTNSVGSSGAPDTLILLAEDEATLIGNNARRRERRKNEKVEERYLEEVDLNLVRLLIGKYQVDPLAIPLPKQISVPGSIGLRQWRQLGMYGPWSRSTAQAHTFWVSVFHNKHDSKALLYVPAKLTKIILVRDGRYGDSARSKFSDGLSWKIAKILH